MSNPNGVGAYQGSWKTETFHTADKNINLKIEQSFWSHTVVYGQGSYIVSKVKVTNAGSVPLKNVKVFVDVDDTSIMFDAFLTNSSGTIVDSTVLDFGDLNPGASASEGAYWWTVRQRFPEAEGTDTNDVFLNVAPEFTVSMKSMEGFRSVSKLDKS